MDGERLRNMLIKIKGPTLPRIHTTGPTLPKVGASVVAQVLGAEAVSIERPKLKRHLALADKIHVSSERQAKARE